VASLSEGVVATGGERPARLGWILAGLGPLLFVLVPYWQIPPLPYGTLDGGWRAVLGHFAYSGLRLGDDLVYTTGPLGFLRTSQLWPDTYPHLLAWGILLGLALAAVFGHAMTRLPVAGRWAVLAALVLLVLVRRSQLADLLYALEALLLFDAMLPRVRERWWVEALAAAALATGALILVSNLVTALWVVGAVTVLRYWTDRSVSPLPAFFAGSFGVLWLLSGQPLSVFGDYLHWGFEMISGYPEVMGVWGPLWEVALAPLAFAALLVVLWVDRPPGEDPRRRLVLSVALAGLFFLAFKSGFVRHVRPRIVVPMVPVLAMVVGLATLRHRWPRGALLRLAALALVALAALLTLTPAPEQTPWAFLRARVRSAAWNVRILADGGPDLALLRRQDEASRARTRAAMPLSPLEGPVDVFGDAQGVALAHGLELTPRPVFQSFAAYTPELAKHNARHYRESPPPLVLAQSNNFGRLPSTLLDARLFLELWSRYEPVEELGAFQLLRLRPGPPRRYRLVEVLSTTLELGEELTLQPHADAGPLWAEIEAPPNLLGRLVAFAFKPVQLRLRVGSGDGGERQLGFAAGPASGGFLLSPLVANGRQLARFIERGDKAPSRFEKIDSLVLEEPQSLPVSLRRDATIRLYRLEAVAPPAAAPAPPSEIPAP
jgi:hypothetical protein